MYFFICKRHLALNDQPSFIKIQLNFFGHTLEILVHSVILHARPRLDVRKIVTAWFSTGVNV